MRVDNVNVRRSRSALRAANAYKMTCECFRPPAASKRETLCAHQALHGHVRLLRRQSILRNAYDTHTNTTRNLPLRRRGMRSRVYPLLGELCIVL